MKSLLNKPFLSMTDYTPEEFAYYPTSQPLLRKTRKKARKSRH